MTDFQKRKWSKAISQIFCGVMMIIVLILFLGDLRIMPEILRGPYVVGFITVLFIFLIVWCFLSAAVNIIIGVRTKEEPVKLSEIGKRIDSLGKNINAITGAATDEEKQEPKTDESLKKGSKKSKTMIVLAVILLVIAIIIVGVVLLAFNIPPDLGAASPEQALNTFIDRMNANDAQGATLKTVWTLASNSSDYVDRLSTFLTTEFVSADLIGNPDVFPEQMINIVEKNQTIVRVGEIEKSLNVNVSEYCVAAFQLSVTTTHGSKTISERIPCVFVDERWYADIEKVFRDME